MIAPASSLENGMMLGANPAEYGDDVRDSIPLRRWGQPRDVARTVLFFLSEDGGD